MDKVTIWFQLGCYFFVIATTFPLKHKWKEMGE